MDMIRVWFVICVAVILISCSSEDQANNILPTVSAGVDISAIAGDRVSLSGHGSVNNGSVMNYKWTQTKGSAITFDDQTSASISFKIPEHSMPEELIFELTVTDDDNGSATDSVSVFIKPEVNSNLQNELKAQFDKNLNAILNSDSYISGFLISDASNKAHRATITLVSYATSGIKLQGLPSDKTWRVGEKQLYDQHILVDNQSNVYMVKNGSNFNDGNKFEINARNTVFPDLYLQGVDDNSVEFRYGYMHSNAYFIQSLIRMYKITFDENYLVIAKLASQQLIKSIGDDYKYDRRFLHEERWVYTGMNNGISIRALNAVAETTGDIPISRFVREMAKRNKHTGEGIWNHWGNSALGVLETHKILQTDPRSMELDMEKQLAILSQYIIKYDGQIPYLKDESDPRFPRFTDSYHTYDLMLLGLMELATNLDMGISEIFELALSKVVFNSITWGNTTEAYMAATQAFNYRNDEFAKKLYGNLSSEPTNLIYSVSLLRSISAFSYMLDNSLVDEALLVQQ